MERKKERKKPEEGSYKVKNRCNVIVWCPVSLYIYNFYTKPSATKICHFILSKKIYLFIY